MNVRLNGSPGFQRLSSGVRIDLREARPAQAAGEGHGPDLEVALRSTEDALGLIRRADGRLQTAAARLGRLEPVAQEGPHPPTSRERLESLLSELSRVQAWLVAAIDDLTAVGENDAAARSGAPQALAALGVVAGQRGTGGAR